MVYQSSVCAFHSIDVYLCVYIYITNHISVRLCLSQSRLASSSVSSMAMADQSSKTVCIFNQSNQSQVSCFSACVRRCLSGKPCYSVCVVHARDGESKLHIFLSILSPYTYSVCLSVCLFSRSLCLSLQEEKVPREQLTWRPTSRSSCSLRKKPCHVGRGRLPGRRPRGRHNHLLGVSVSRVRI